MARKKAQNQDQPPKVQAVQVQEEEEAEEEDDYEENDELELLQVELGDMVKLKQVLDEAVSAAIFERAPEDYRLDNFKLALMTAACIFAVIAQFAPIPFPESRPVLGACCCMYFVLSGVLQFITTFVDKDCILLTRPLEDNPKNKDMEKHGLRVRSQLPRFSEWYTLILEFQDRQDTPNVEQKWSVGQFFDKEGMFDEIGLMKKVGLLFDRITEGKYDNLGTTAKKNN